MLFFLPSKMADTLDGQVQWWFAGSCWRSMLGAVDLKAATAEVMQSNRMRAAAERIQFAGGGERIKHVIYIIKENRTLRSGVRRSAAERQAGGEWRCGLAMYGAAGDAKSARAGATVRRAGQFFRFGRGVGRRACVVERGDWTDYLEKTWQQEYRNGAADVRLRGGGVGWLPAAAEDCGCGGAKERIYVGQCGGARKDALQLRRVHLFDLLRYEEEREYAGGAAAGEV